MANIYRNVERLTLPPETRNLIWHIFSFKEAECVLFPCYTCCMMRIINIISSTQVNSRIAVVGKQLCKKNQRFSELQLYGAKTKTLLIVLKVAVFWVVMLCSLIEVFRGTVFLRRLHSWWTQQDSRRHWYIYTRTHRVTSQKTAFVVTTMRVSNVKFTLVLVFYFSRLSL